MKKLINTLALFVMMSAVIVSCKNEDDAATHRDNLVSPEVLQQIKQLGFSTERITKEDRVYIVEGDIRLHEEDLHRALHAHTLRVGEVEQYRTTNLVTGLPRTIRVAITTSLPSSYGTALNTAISRYNNENLRIRFQRVSSYPVDILVTKAPSGASYLASAGFPSGGNPYNQILVNSDFLGSNPVSNYLATILAHEIGHCIGFRHTDYMDRSYSCGGSFFNEGSGGVGAIHIPGTPTGPDPNSRMLACIGAGQNRPFNANDKIALDYLY